MLKNLEQCYNSEQKWLQKKILTNFLHHKKSLLISQPLSSNFHVEFYIIFRLEKRYSTRSSPLQGQNPLQAMRTDVWWMQLWYSSRHGELYVRLSLPQRNVGLTTGHSWHLEQKKRARAVLNCSTRNNLIARVCFPSPCYFLPFTIFITFHRVVAVSSVVIKIPRFFLSFRRIFFYFRGIFLLPHDYHRSSSRRFLREGKIRKKSFISIF